MTTTARRLPLLGLLAATALLYLWTLSASGWANDFYDAAQAAIQSWKAFFFGSSDAANFITVDKPPAAPQVMGLSARLFGVSSWSLLVPQALMGVATVALVHATVRRWFGPAAGLLAGAVTALTPVATLIFQFQQPGTLLVLLLVAAAYAVVQALEHGITRWLVLAGVCVGFGFLAKQLQALLVVPAFTLVYLAAARVPLGRRLGQPGRGRGGRMIALGRLVGGGRRAHAGVGPAGRRGSQTSSVLELTFGYNGLGRLTGNETGGVGAGPGGGWSRTGWGRMFRGRGRWPGRLARSRRRCSCWRSGCGWPAERRGPAGLGPPSPSGAAGWSSPGWCSASCRASSTPTTPVALAPPSGRWSGWAPPASGRGGTARRPAGGWPGPWP